MTRLISFLKLTALTIAVAAPQCLAQTGSSPPPLATVQAQPAPPVSGEQRVAEMYAKSLEGLTSSLEKVIEAQANQINVFSWAVSILGLLLALAGFSVVKFFRRTVQEAVDERVLALVTGRIDIDSLKSAKLNAVLFQTLAIAARDVALSRKRDLVAKVESGALGVNGPQEVDKLVSLLADATLQPLHVMSNVYSVLSADEEPPKVRERILVLFAEVAADKIGPRAMHGLITALINIAHNQPSRSGAMPYLTAFSKQLSEAIESGIRPEEPIF